MAEVDVGHGRLTVASGQTASGLVTQIMNGIVNGGTAGITSSHAAASGGAFTVGWLDNGDGSMTYGYAAAGDINLDWSIDILDIADFMSSGLFNAGPYNAPAANIAAVPEPGIFATAFTGLACLAWRTYQRRRGRSALSRPSPTP